MNKKRIIIVFALLCCIIIISFINKKPFYIHKEVAEIEQIKITKIFSTPNMEQDDKIEDIILQDKKEIDDMISKLKSYSFRKTISLKKAISLTPENITTFFISVYYKPSEEGHYDRIQIYYTEDRKTEKIEINCYNDVYKKDYHAEGKVITMQQFLEDMQTIFEKEDLYV